MDSKQFITFAKSIAKSVFDIRSCAYTKGVSGPDHRCELLTSDDIIISFSAIGDKVLATSNHSSIIKKVFLSDPGSIEEFISLVQDLYHAAVRNKALEDWKNNRIKELNYKREKEKEEFSRKVAKYQARHRNK